MNWYLSDCKVHVALYENIVLEHVLLNLFPQVFFSEIPEEFGAGSGHCVSQDAPERKNQSAIMI